MVTRYSCILAVGTPSRKRQQPPFCTAWVIGANIRSWARGLGSLNIKPVPAGLPGPHPPAGRPGTRHSTPCPGAENAECTRPRVGASLAPGPVPRGLPTLPARSPRGGGCCLSGLGQSPLRPRAHEAPGTMASGEWLAPQPTAGCAPSPEQLTGMAAAHFLRRPHRGPCSQAVSWQPLPSLPSQALALRPPQAPLSVLVMPAPTQGCCAQEEAGLLWPLPATHTDPLPRSAAQPRNLSVPPSARL